MTDTVTPRKFTAHLELRAENPTPVMRSGLYDSVGEFLLLEIAGADLNAGWRAFEPSRGNEWLTAGYAAAIAYRPNVGSTADEWPFTLAEYVEGDVTRYRFRRYNDAERAGRLWAVGR